MCVAAHGCRPRHRTGRRSGGSALSVLPLWCQGAPRGSGTDTAEHAGTHMHQMGTLSPLRPSCAHTKVGTPLQQACKWQRQCFPTWEGVTPRSDRPGIPLHAEGPRIHSHGLFSQRPTPFQDPITLEERQPPKTLAPGGAGPWQPRHSKENPTCNRVK